MAASCAATPSEERLDPPREAWRKALLVCGIVSSLLYGAMIGAIRYEGYSLLAQAPSELTAIGAPTRSLWMWLGAVYTVLVVAFGWGVWMSGAGNRAVRAVGGLILAYGSLGLLWPFASMHQRGVLAAGGATPSDTMHVVLAAVTVLLTFLTLGFGAAAFGKRFRLYSIVSGLVLLAFGGLTFLDAPRLQAGLPTPWMGLWERINISVFLTWVIVLALALWRGPEHAARGAARFFAAYDAALRRWPLPFEEVDIPGRFGTTHVVTCGPQGAPPLVLLHGYMATSLMWSPNIVDFAREHRVYAIDTMGQPGRSAPGEPIRSGADYVAWLTATLDALHLDRVSLVGMSFGGWLALTYAAAAPERVQTLVLLSPGGLLPISRQFSLRGMLMVLVPSRITVNSFMHWAGFTGAAAETRDPGVLDLMYLGIKHFPMPGETLRVAANPLSDEELRALRPPVLLLIGDGEVLCDAAMALNRARRLIPDFEGEIIPGCRHGMCVSRHRIVDAKVLDFLRKEHARDRSQTTERSVA